MHTGSVGAPPVAGLVMGLGLSRASSRAVYFLGLW